MKAPFPARSVISIDDLSDSDLQSLFLRAEEFAKMNAEGNKKQPRLTGRTLFNLYFENSTRTRSSFEIAGKRLGMDVVNVTARTSSVSKGETLIDTVASLYSMNGDVIVMRHPRSGAAALINDHVKPIVLNAGDGSHQHPSQALLDAFTILQHKGDINGLKIVICGDILHSRVARSNVQLLTRLGAHVTLVAPPPLMPRQFQHMQNVTLMYDIRQAIVDADVVMMLRIQRERAAGSAIASVRDYSLRYGLNHKKLETAKPDVLVMHPGPINRGVELETPLADDVERSVILKQVEYGVAIREALLEFACGYLCSGKETNNLWPVGQNRQNKKDQS